MRVSLGLCLFCVSALLAVSSVHADDVLLNEWNAVGDGKFIADGDSFFGAEFDGNGGNWFELLTVKDVDMRGWQMNWTEAEMAANGDPISEGTLTFGDDELWATIRAGTIITIIEAEDANGQMVFTGTDTSYDPDAGDWTINISTFEEFDADRRLITTVTNDGGDGEFSVGNDDWQLTILDASGTVVSGPTGEGAADDAGTEVWQGGGISSSEAGALEGPGRGATAACWQSIDRTNVFYDDTKSSSFGLPNVDFIADTGAYRVVQDLTALRGGEPEGFGDFDSSGEFDVADLEVLLEHVEAENNSPCFDLNGDGSVNADDIDELVTNLGGGSYGDANLDGLVDEADHTILTANLFTMDRTWATGDFNADGVTDGTDFNLWNDNKMIEAASSVPEPESSMMLLIGLLLATSHLRLRRLG